MKGKIYSLKDPITNKIKYVGQTKFSLIKRLNEHIRNCRYEETKNQNIYLWINSLLDKNSLPIIELIEEIDIELLNNREKYWISFYGSDLKNMTKGGSGINFIKKREFTESHKKKIGDACRGEKHYNYGKNAVNRKEIIMFTIDGQFIKHFSSIKKASIYSNISISSISNCLRGKRYSSGEYIWMYENEFNVENLIRKIKETEKHLSNKRKSIKIHKIDIKTNRIVETYDSYKEAARINKTSDNALRYACNISKSQIYNNYKWIKKVNHGLDC
jgi:hypothetical protein